LILQLINDTSGSPRINAVLISKLNCLMDFIYALGIVAYHCPSAFASGFISWLATFSSTLCSHLMELPTSASSLPLIKLAERALRIYYLTTLVKNSQSHAIGANLHKLKLFTKNLTSEANAIARLATLRTIVKCLQRAGMNVAATRQCHPLIVYCSLSLSRTPRGPLKLAKLHTSCSVGTITQLATLVFGYSCAIDAFDRASGA
jgi:hypothetical protein